MVTKERTITIAPGSNLARVLGESADRPVVLVVGTTRYRVEPEVSSPPTEAEAEVNAESSEQPDPWSADDPVRLQAGVDAAAGVLSEAEAEQWIADLYRWREEGSRPTDQP